MDGIIFDNDIGQNIDEKEVSVRRKINFFLIFLLNFTKGGCDIMNFILDELPQQRRYWMF